MRLPRSCATNSTRDKASTVPHGPALGDRPGRVGASPKSPHPTRQSPRLDFGLTRPILESLRHMFGSNLV